MLFFFCVFFIRYIVINEIMVIKKIVVIVGMIIMMIFSWFLFLLEVVFLDICGIVEVRNLYLVVIYSYFNVDML